MYTRNLKTSINFRIIEVLENRSRKRDIFQTRSGKVMPENLTKNQSFRYASSLLFFRRAKLLEVCKMSVSVKVKHLCTFHSLQRLVSYYFRMFLKANCLKSTNKLIT